MKRAYPLLSLLAALATSTAALAQEPARHTVFSPAGLLPWPGSSSSDTEFAKGLGRINTYHQTNFARQDKQTTAAALLT